MPELSTNEWDQLNQRYNKGESRKSLCAYFNVSSGAIDKYRTRRQMPPRQRQEHTLYNIRGYKDLWDKTIPNKVLAYNYKVTSVTISNWKKRLNISNERQRIEKKKKKRQLRFISKIRNTRSSKKRALKHKYGISRSQLGRMIRTQNRKCAICEKRFIGDYCVDHNHITKQVRAVLCSSCNYGLGCLKDSANICQRAAEYLVRFTNS